MILDLGMSLCIAYHDICLAIHFQETINDIQGQMNDHYAKNAKLREENLELANKLKNLIEQYELREQVCMCQLNEITVNQLLLGAGCCLSHCIPHSMPMK